MSKRRRSRKARGPQLKKRDDDDDVLEQNNLQFLDSLPKSIDDICKIEVSTRGQTSNDLWKEHRSNMLTASNFGTVCKLRKTTDPKRLLIIYYFHLFTDQSLQNGDKIMNLLR
ncbi:unnamed protein product [Psylliodes chrysocephalus]|uniref:Uncharacterized protein n=1 Tax=Psylliodes chrysocephalus TaxID=3402493 RepID=A0A9P0CM62_9CUCU|nr:unnamed protein product [Psylliodes chrysocephala]